MENKTTDDYEWEEETYEWDNMPPYEIKSSSIEKVVEEIRTKRTEEEENKKKIQIEMIYESAKEIKELKKIIQDMRRDIVRMDGELHELRTWRSKHKFMVMG